MAINRTHQSAALTNWAITRIILQLYQLNFNFKNKYLISFKNRQILQPTGFSSMYFLMNYFMITLSSTTLNIDPQWNVTGLEPAVSELSARCFDQLNYTSLE